MGTHIKQLVGRFLEKKKQEAGQQEEIQRIVNRVLGKDVQEGVWLKKISKNELVFNSGSSSLSYDFGLKREKILKAVKEKFPQIKTVKIGIE